jgi:high affinity Mn2+ porin
VRREAIIIGVIAVTALVGTGRAQDAGEQAYGAKFQATYVWQRKYPFGAAYTGTNSLTPDIEKSYSFTATAALGARLWKGGEVYLDPEVAQGVPLSHLTGLGGFANGEIARTSGPSPSWYVARFFLRQTWGLGGDSEAVESDANQLAGSVERRRLVLTAGKLSLTDLFDDNAYNHDPRTQFLNWSLMTHGAWDYAADSRGYSWGFALEYFDEGWVLRAARFTMPKQSNSLALNPHILESFGDQIELEHSHTLGGKAGKLRLLAYRNQADMGGYRDSIADAAASGGTPDLATSRKRRTKYGFGLNLEQSLSADIGVFARASRNNGEAEEFAFTEIDRSISAGVLVRGAAWNRASDSFGVAVVKNGISGPHRDYLAAGGLGFFIGDGKLSYRSENIVEVFYSFGVVKDVWISVDFQRIFDPAYNSDRGPVSVASARIHYGF